MANFDWQTEDDGKWSDSQPAEGERPEGRRGRWLPPALVVMGVLVLGGLLYWQLSNRVGGAENARNEDIVAASKLLFYAADRKDASVLLNILPVDDRVWTGLQRELVRRGLLLDRWPLGIYRTSEEAVIEAVELAPDLLTAEVSVEVPYRVVNQGRTESFRLRQVHQYQFRNEWHWMAPDDDYWLGAGDDLYEKYSIAALYPPRDEEIVKRLVDDLPTYLGQAEICNGPGLPACGFVMSFLIRFEREPSFWLALSDYVEQSGAYTAGFVESSRGVGTIFLPTPSLVGLPVDEAGYQALLRGYSSHILAAVMGELYDEGCCPGDVPFPIFLENEMARRGIGFWPPAALQDDMAAQSERLPEREVALLCAAAEPGRLQLYRFNLGNGRIFQEMAGRNLVRIRSAPGGAGIIAQEVEEVGEDERLTRLILWHDNTARILYEETLPEPVFAASWWQVLEDEAGLLMVVPDLDSRVTTFTRIDLAECAAGSCPTTTREMIGAPLWSPDGSQFLINAGNILWWRRFVGSEIEQEPLGLGTVPFWLDAESFGYVRTGENRFQEIVTAAAGDEEAGVVLNSERMRLILGEGVRPEQLMIGYVGLDPLAGENELNHWIILAFEWFSNGELGEAFIFSYDPEEDGLAVKLQSGQLHSFNVSPDGRWLAASLYDERLASWRLKIEGLEAGGEATVRPWLATEEDEPLRYDWTADSRWLLVLHRGVLTLFSPETNSELLAPPPVAGCVEGVWG
jgi:hypothetical protein